jgi:hypothetical protein
MPDGSMASYEDIAPDQSPVLASSGTLAGCVYFFSVTGGVSNGSNYPLDPPDGGVIASHATEAENGLSNIYCPINCLLGVFLGSDAPDQQPAPPALDFDPAETREFDVLAPELQQVFYIGDGLRSDGLGQQFVAPAGARRLFLGTMDGYGWSNNLGAFAADVITDCPTVGAVDTPQAFALAPAFPNPFNPTTTLSYTLAETSTVRLAVYDVAGRQVAVLSDGLQTSGTHQVNFDAAGLPAGLYLARLEANGRSETQKLLLVK